ncbi:hypothetical protein NliqN6_1794 [Naganishia liquefaciens]|uniref:Uncharacterized protein n=1 Tax=Naganishia liquefaciens TaxID=104408 RepID=A0A8H3YEM3_9TREE|nr:hypothetical protein NliqN6_1794 [Naganishia liquefaciens]
MISVFSLAAWLLAFSSAALAQLYTTTLPWIDGDTVVVSQSTNALGATVIIQTLAVVGQPTTSDTSTSTSWYWYTTDGVEYSTYFSPTFTTISSATPAPSGTIQDYSEYLSSVNAGASSAYANLSSGAIARDDNLGATIAAWVLSVGAIGFGALAIF